MKDLNESNEKMKVKLICTSVRISTDLIQTSTQNRPAAPQTETPVTTYTTGLWSPVRDKQMREIVLLNVAQKHIQMNSGGSTWNYTPGETPCEKKKCP